MLENYNARTGRIIPVWTIEIQTLAEDTDRLPFYDEMGEDGLRAYWTRKNAQSIDGKPTGILG